jgi:hypothetical protein
MARRVAWIGALALGGLLLCAPPAGADGEDAVKAQLAYDRDRLVDRARQSVDPAHPDAGNIEDLRKTLFELQTAIELVPFAERAPQTAAQLELAIALLGTPESPGTIREAAGFWRWMAGVGDVQPVLELADPENDATRIPYSAEPPDVPAPAAPQAGDEEAGDAERPEPQGPSQHQLDQWTIKIVRGPDGAVLGPRVKWLLWLPSAKARPAEKTLVPLALTQPDEIADGMSRRWLDAREKQVTPRVEAFKAEQPSTGLVNDGIVAQKLQRVNAYAARIARVEKARAGATEALDRLVIAERTLQDEAGRIGFELEEAKRKAETGGDAAAQGVLAQLRLREIVLEQKLRLLYLTVRRAALRMELQDVALRQYKEESDAAKLAHQRFDAELSKLRRARQLDRLASETRALGERHDEAHARAEKEDEPERALWTAYDHALEALIELNATTTAAVRMRRALERSATAPTGGAAPASEAAAGAAGAAAEKGAKAPGGGFTTAEDPLRRFRDPKPGSLDASFVRDATALLDHPDWDAHLAASHHDLVRRRIEALETALQGIKGRATLEARFQEAVAGAQKALEEAKALGLKGKDPYRWRTWVWRLERQNLQPNVSAFKETMAGIEEGRLQVEKELAAFRAYRKRLLGLGSRSFGIRVQRELDADRLGDAFGDTAGGLRDVGRWLSFQGEEHLGTFVARNWAALLGALALLIGLFFAVRLGRRGLDRVVRRLASKVPQLRAEPVTIRAEEAEAKRGKAVLEAAARQAEEAALRAVSKDEAAQQQRMGEGGYSDS